MPCQNANKVHFCTVHKVYKDCASLPFCTVKFAQTQFNQLNTLSNYFQISVLVKEGRDGEEG
jgi:hypothetical protein